jgi:transketolase
MRNIFAETIFKESQNNNKIFILVADISPAGKMLRFQKQFPNRFLNVGVSEQTMIGMCAGLSMKGMRPFAYTISTFALYRPFEMIRVDLCYQNLPVTIVGMGAGTIYSNLGGTHLTQEDISVARSVPNLNIIAPCDPLELESAVKYCCNVSNSPVYLRIGKVGENILTNSKNIEKWKFGKIRKIAEGKNICFLSFGPIIKKAFNIREKLKLLGITTAIYSCHTLKPFDIVGLKKIFKRFNTLVIIEDHSLIGGLSSIIKSNAFDFSFKGSILSFSLKDKFIKCYGSQDDLLKKHGISESSILRYITKSIKNHEAT